MTTIPAGITCETFSDQLMDFLEGDLDVAARAAMEAHARGCRECGSVLAGVRRLRAQAAGLPSLVPPRDLWSEIAERIDAPAVPLAARRPLWRARMLTGAAVAATFVLAAVLGYETTHRSAVSVVTGDAGLVAGPSTVETLGARPPAAASRGPRAQTPAVRLAAATPARVEASYDPEIARLRAVIDLRRSQLDPVTVAIVEKNLRVIDEAISQCRSALARDPASRFLMQAFNQSLDNKVQLLRAAAMLPPRS